jgi:hypothetical protein
MGALEQRRFGYSEREVKAILARAMDLPDQHGEAFSREQMAELAAELGISEAQLEAAEQTWVAEQQVEALTTQRKAFIRSRRRQMRNGLVGYAVMGGLLYLAFVLEIAVLSLIWPFLMVPMFIIAIILFFGTWEAIFDVEGEDFDKEFAKWQDRHEEQLARVSRSRPAGPPHTSLDQ